MRFPISWVKEFVPLPSDIELLSRGFTFSGTEVDEIFQENGESIFDFGFTVNRPDLMNIFGLAREASAIFGLPSPLYTAKALASGDSIERNISIEIMDPALCPRYRALLIKGVKVGESPHKINNRLTACGLRPVNSVVDATNYALLEYGHTLHAFDMRHIKQDKIIVRRAAKGEKLLMLDGIERNLTEEMLVIADGVRPLVVAGIMGGEEAGVTFTTKDILLEGAVFDPSSIRRTSKALNIHTDASHRYERGVDYEGPVLALEKAAEIIMESCGGTLARDCIDLMPARQPRSRITFRLKSLGRVLGIAVEEEKAVAILQSLGFSIEKAKDGEFLVDVPSFRVDVHREIDLIEEVIRIYGLDKLPSNLPQGIDIESGRNLRTEVEDEIKLRLSSKGLTEAIHLSMTDPKLDAIFSSGKEPVRISNPLSETNSVLRQSLLPNLLLTVKRNSSYGQKIMGLFEVGHVYLKNGVDSVSEKGRLAVMLYEEDAPKTWNQPPSRDILALKSIVESVYESFHIPCEFKQAGISNGVYSRNHYLQILQGGKDIGFMAYLDPLALQELDVKGRIAVAEMAIDSFFAKKEPAFEPFSRFPVSKRDISVIVPSGKKWGEIEESIKSLNIAELAKVELIEIYSDKKIGDDKKSVTISLAFQSLTRTLSESEAEDKVKNIVTALNESAGAFLRQE
jgi:phenylalanyl-tRNA synthetase beta chain